jgi:SAM-dependent methyltransferase
VPDRPSFPWTPDQLQRYAFLREAVAGLRLGRPFRLLDVGGAASNRDGSLGWFPALEIFADPDSPKDEITVLDRPEFEAEGYIRGDGRALPFPDGAFDVVSALDVLEHVPATDRPVFLREMVRVASRLVVLAGPRADDAVRAAEQSVAGEIRKLYRIEHVQLAEHEANGLISDSETREALEASGAAVASAGFGALASWTEMQGLRSRYLMRRKTPLVLEKLDAYLASRDAAPEFEPPFYRMFWLASKARAREDLDDLANGIRARLLEAPPVSAEEREEKYRHFAAAAAEMEAGAFLSALVISRGDAAVLRVCLNRLLTQEVDFDFEIVVWDAGGRSGSVEDILREHPRVRFLGRGKPELETGAILDAAAGLRGDGLLFMDDGVKLPPQGAAKLQAARASDPRPGVWAWRGSWKRFFTWSRAGRGRARPAAGKIPRLLRGPEIIAKPEGGWIYGRCLLVGREALEARRSAGRETGSRSLFLWD